MTKRKNPWKTIDISQTVSDQDERRAQAGHLYELPAGKFRIMLAGVTRDVEGPCKVDAELGLVFPIKD